MGYSIAEEFIRIFKSIDVEFNLGHWTSGFANESLFKVSFSLPVAIPAMTNFLRSEQRLMVFLKWNLHLHISWFRASFSREISSFEPDDDRMQNSDLV